jgi:hypothetical protein
LSHRRQRFIEQRQDGSMASMIIGEHNSIASTQRSQRLLALRCRRRGEERGPEMLYAPGPRTIRFGKRSVGAHDEKVCDQINGAPEGAGL